MLRSSSYKAYFNRSACIVDKSCDLLPPVPARHEEQQIGDSLSHPRPRSALRRIRLGRSGSIDAAQRVDDDRPQDHHLAPKCARAMACTGQTKQACMSMRQKGCTGSQLCSHARAQMHVRGAKCDVGVMEALSDAGRGARARWFKTSPLCIPSLCNLVDCTAE